MVPEKARKLKPEYRLALGALGLLLAALTWWAVPNDIRSAEERQFKLTPTEVTEAMTGIRPWLAIDEDYVFPYSAISPGTKRKLWQAMAQFQHVQPIFPLAPPMAASSDSRVREESHWTAINPSMAETAEPISKPGRLRPSSPKEVIAMKARATPGRVAWAIASLTRARFLKNRNVPVTPAAMPSSTAPMVTSEAL